MQQVINRTEILCIQIFRWLIMIAVAIILLVSLWLGIKGVLSLPGARKDAEPAKAAPELIVQYSQWLADNKPKESVPSVSSSVPTKAATDTNTTKFIAQTDVLWPFVAAYQLACKTPNPFTKEQFVESLRQTNLQSMLSSRTDNFASSQVAFTKQALESSETVKLCLSGKTGIFLSIIEFHRQNYDRNAMTINAFDRAEQERISQFPAVQERERDRQFSNAQQVFTLAGGAFGLFLGLMLLLVFTRIEVNLRAISATR